MTSTDSRDHQRRGGCRCGPGGCGAAFQVENQEGFLVAMWAIAWNCPDPAREAYGGLWVIVTPIVSFLSSAAGQVVEAARAQSNPAPKESAATTKIPRWALGAAGNRKPPRVSTFPRMVARGLAGGAAQR